MKLLMTTVLLVLISLCSSASAGLFRVHQAHVKRANWTKTDEGKKARIPMNERTSAPTNKPQTTQPVPLTTEPPTTKGDRITILRVVHELECRPRLQHVRVRLGSCVGHHEARVCVGSCPTIASHSSFGDVFDLTSKSPARRWQLDVRSRCSCCQPVNATETKTYKVECIGEVSKTIVVPFFSKCACRKVHRC